MSIHQVIYTSCMRGINGLNDGQQIFSHDASFQDVGSDEVKSLFAYRHPALASGVVMNEQIAASMPKAFIYRRLPSGRCALALNTYLGRDYMGSAGRFGNHMSHVIVFEPRDTRAYPAEYYAGALLRDRMRFEEVNNPERPDYLPVPVLEPGNAVSMDAVTDFLASGNRIEVFKQMLCAMLAFERERKRVVICDTQENIILWIAALGYALPLRSALNVSFSTYDYDPSLSSSRVCGVMPKGTRFQEESQKQHFVFDLYTGRIPSMALEPEFYDFIDTALAFSPESLLDFHGFVNGGYRYEGADEQIYAAYGLYTLLSDGMDSIRPEHLERVIAFADDFAGDEELFRILQALLRERETLLRGTRQRFLQIIHFCLRHRRLLDEKMDLRLKELIVDRILQGFCSADVDAGAFAELYTKLNELCAGNGISIATELMQPHHRKKLFAVMGKDVAFWKITYIIRVISDFVKDQQMDASGISPETALGQVYCGIVRSLYQMDPARGLQAVQTILENFVSHSSHLFNMGLNMEGVLLDLPGGEHQSKAMWSCFHQILSDQPDEVCSEAYRFFYSYRRYDRMLTQFVLKMKRTMDPTQAREAFDQHYRTYGKLAQACKDGYHRMIAEAYYRRLGAFAAADTLLFKEELFRLLLEDRIDAAFSDYLIEEIVKPIPMDPPNRQSKKLLREIQQYVCGLRRQPARGRALLLLIGAGLDGAKDQNEIFAQIDLFTRMTTSARAELKLLGRTETRHYFEWILEGVCELCVLRRDMEAVLDLFAMTPAAQVEYFGQSAGRYLKLCDEERDYEPFLEFLELVRDRADNQALSAVRAAVGSLGKKELAKLDRYLLHRLSRTPEKAAFWAAIRDGEVLKGGTNAAQAKKRPFWKK